jgi:hypothetical protein
MEPRRAPFAAYTNVFEPILTDLSESRSHEDPYASTAAVPPTPAATARAAITVTATTAPRRRRFRLIAR